MRYRLSMRSIGSSLPSAFAWEPDETFERADRDLALEIIEQGKVTTEGYALQNTGPGNPSYVEHDGTYYEITVEKTGTWTVARVSRRHAALSGRTGCDGRRSAQARLRIGWA